MSDDILAELVEGERAALRPTPTAKKATWKRVARSVAIAAPVPAAPSMPTATAKVVASGAKWWVKGIVAVAIGGAAVAGVGAVAGDRGRDVAIATPAAGTGEAAVDAPVGDGPATDDRDAAPSASGASSSIGGEPSQVADAPEQPPGTHERPAAPRAAVARTKPPRASAEEPPPEVASPAASTLAEEAELVVAARRELNAGDPRAALVSLRVHARRFPDGQLTEERVALTARALCESGERARGLKEAAALRAAFPSSSHLPRVDRACE